MICGALQTLNEDAFEDVLGSERPSPTGEHMLQHLAPIRESSELGSPTNTSLHSGNLFTVTNNSIADSTVIMIPQIFSSSTIDDTSL